MREKSLIGLSFDGHNSYQELSDLTYRFSHDFGAPIRHISEFSRLLENRLEQNLSSTEKKYLEIIRSSACNLEVMVNAWVDYNQLLISEFNPQQVDMNGLLADVLADLSEDIAQCNAQIEYKELPSIFCDPRQVRRLMREILRNSFESSECTVVPIVKIKAIDGVDRYIVSVEDNGAGVDEKDRYRIFKPFVKLDVSRFYNAGMGLAIARRIVETHNGNIGIDKCMNGGSVVSFTINKNIAAKNTYS